MINSIMEVMKNPRLKVKRAEKHIASLITDSAALPNDLYEFTGGPARSKAILQNPDCYRLVYQPKEPINEYFGATVGDAVNNLREALDYWLNNAMAWRTRAPSKRHFPFAEKFDDLKSSRYYPSVERDFPELAAKISSDIKPCRDTHLHLWAVTSLCNGNKHNDFLPVASIANTSRFDASIGGRPSIINMAIEMNANNQIAIIHADEPIEVNNHVSLSAEITFPEGAIFENQPVIPTLTNMSKTVGETLDSLEAFLRSL